MSNKLLKLKQINNFLVNSLYSKSEAFLIVILALILLTVVIVFPKNTAQGNVIQDNIAGTWEGTLGPTQDDVDYKSASLAINYNTSLSQYEAGLVSNDTSAYIRSTLITAPVGTFNKWKQLKLGLRKPDGSNTTIKVAIICGDATQCGTVDQPISGYDNITLNPSNEYTFPPAGLTVTKIKIRVSFSSTDVSQPQTVLYNWQVFWEVNSGVSLTVSKTPNPANPVLQTGPDAYPTVGGVPISNNNIVVYTLSYSLNRNVNNLKIELPTPSGTYTPISGTPKTYTASYQGSSGGSFSGGKVIWNKGNLLAGTVGSESVTFKINSGPPEGTIFKTKAKIYDDGYSATLPDDSLNIVSKGFTFVRAISPEFIAPNREVNYVLYFGDQYWWQSDMFNPRYEFVYSSCLSNTFDPIVKGSGASSVSIDKTNRKITFNFPSPMTQPPYSNYGVTLKSNLTCGATVGGSVTFYSEQDGPPINSFIRNKVTNAAYNSSGQLSKWDSTSTPRMYVSKEGYPNPAGAGQIVRYTLRFDQRSNVPITNFYVIDAIPAQTTFYSANISPGVLHNVSAIPQNWKIYWSSNASGPWTELLNGPVPCGGSGCQAPPGQEGNVKYIKYESSTFNWDRNANYNEPLGWLTVITDTTAAGTLTNNITAYASNTCITGCPYSYPMTVNNQPGFVIQYRESTNESCNPSPGGAGGGGDDVVVVSSGKTYCSFVTIYNWNSNTMPSNGDAKEVNITIRLPNKTFLESGYNLLNNDPPNPPNTEIYARCLMAAESSNCPNGDLNPDGSLKLYSNPDWLRPNGSECSGPGDICTVSWLIPIIYSGNKYPVTYPNGYRFYFLVDTKLGLPDQTEICQGFCRVSALTSKPPPSNSNIDQATTNKVKIASSVVLNASLKHVPEEKNSLSCASDSDITYKIEYSHAAESTGGVDNLFVIDALPIDTTVVPNAKLIYKGYSVGNVGLNMTGYYMSNRSRYLDPPSSTDVGWKPLSGIPPGDKPEVDWVMWKRSSIYNIDASPEYVTLTLEDQQGCSPNGTLFTNRALVSYLANESSGTPPTILSIITEIVNPGFVSTSSGNVGSKDGFADVEGVMLPPKCASESICSTTYALIGSGQITAFNSFKDWVIEDYTLPDSTTQTNYAKMFKDYGSDAVECVNQATCFDNSAQKVKIFKSSGGVLKIGGSLNYGGVPRILFIDTDLEINTNINISSESALIFIVNRDVKVNYGVTQIDGVFLVEGQFATGKRGTLGATTKDAGQYAAISVGGDGFARIAYWSENNIRFIRCKDLDCTNKDYGYVATATNVTSINMVLYNNEYPKIIVGMLDGNNVATTKFISCRTANCLGNPSPIVNTYSNAKDPDVFFAMGTPFFIFGSGTTDIPRLVNYFGCTTPDCDTPTSVGIPIDGGPGDTTSSPTGSDKGNEISMSSALQGTYVDRTPGKSDLWFTRFGSIGSGNCPSYYPPTDRYWSCKRLTNSPGNVADFPSSFTNQSDITKIFYTDSSTKQIIYLRCSDNLCSTQTTHVIDCGTAPGDTCQAQPYVSSAGTGLVSYVLYNTKNTTTGNNNNEVKLGMCLEQTGNCNSFWISKFPISNIPGSGSGTNITTNAKSYTQSLAIGSDGFPRIVFYDGNEHKLWYVRCTTWQCESANKINFRLVDDGSAVALPDSQLKINGAVIAYGNNVTAPAVGKAFNLQRDLFGENSTKPGEIFTFEPKYYYLFKEIIKPPEYIKEELP